MSYSRKPLCRTIAVRICYIRSQLLSSALVGYGEKSAVRCSSTATHVFYIEGWRSVTSMASRWVDSSNNKKTSGRFQECQQLKKQKVLTKFSDHTNYTNLIQSIYQHETKTPTINWHFATKISPSFVFVGSSIQLWGDGCADDAGDCAESRQHAKDTNLGDLGTWHLLWPLMGNSRMFCCWGFGWFSGIISDFMLFLSYLVNVLCISLYWKVVFFCKYRQKWGGAWTWWIFKMIQGLWHLQVARITPVYLALTV